MAEPALLKLRLLLFISWILGASFPHLQQRAFRVSSPWRCQLLVNPLFEPRYVLACRSAAALLLFLLPVHCFAVCLSIQSDFITLLPGHVFRRTADFTL